MTSKPAKASMRPMASRTRAQKQALNDCKVKGVISTMPEIPGLAVWTKTGGHIGLYMGGGKVIEMRGLGIFSRKNLIDRSSKRGACTVCRV